MLESAGGGGVLEGSGYGVEEGERGREGEHAAGREGERAAGRKGERAAQKLNNLSARIYGEGKIRNAGERLGYAKLKKEQIDVIDSFVKGNDVFAVLPTGFGKSLCFACLPSLFDSSISWLSCNILSTTIADCSSNHCIQTYM